MINSLTRARKLEPGNNYSREVVTLDMMSQVVNEVMTEDELLGFFSSLGYILNPVFESLHYYQNNSHLLLFEGANIEVSYNRRTLKYHVSMW